MTVCIAAISQGSLILASDRMLTADDMQFEPASGKVMFLTRSIAAMFSGDAAFHMEVLEDVAIEVNNRVAAAPNDWLKVRDVAHLYLDRRNSAKQRRAETAILAPLGLNRASFLHLQKGMDAALVKHIAEDLINYRVPDVEVIVAGVDLRYGPPSPSLYAIQGEHLSQRSAVGFAAIGSGSRHAESQFMLARHSAASPFAEAILLVFQAKRDSEIAPGVGAETDLYVIGSNIGQSAPLPPEIRDKLEAEYKKLKIGERRVRDRARREMTRYAEDLGKAATAASQAQPPSGEGPALSGGGQTQEPDPGSGPEINERAPH